MLKVNKLLYIGTGLHINPITNFTNTKEFIFIDTLPKSEYSEKKINYNYNFCNELITKLNNHNFKLTKTFNNNNKIINSTLIKFYNNNTNQKVNYYISTNFADTNNNKLINDIETSDALLVSSLYPNKKLLNYFTFPKKLFCNYSIIYNFKRDHWLDDEYDESIFSVLDTESTLKYFNELYLIKNNKIQYFNSINELKESIC
jgi:hypothetical protein